jgi:hypothetical protein
MLLLNGMFFDLFRIRKFPGQTEPTMSAEVELISTMAEKKSWTRPPIQMEFQVPMFTASGLRVRFLKVQILVKSHVTFFMCKEAAMT